MHYVPVLSLGTYYTKAGMQWAHELPGAREMQGWVFHVKDKYPTADLTVRHPHSADARRYILKNAKNAYWYAASVGQILESHGIHRWLHGWRASRQCARAPPPVGHVQIAR
jgi:hypothetical protein